MFDRSSPISSPSLVDAQLDIQIPSSNPKGTSLLPPAIPIALDAPVHDSPTQDVHPDLQPQVQPPEPQSNDEGEGRVNGTVTGPDSNSDSPTTVDNPIPTTNTQDSPNLPENSDQDSQESTQPVPDSSLVSTAPPPSASRPSSPSEAGKASSFPSSNPTETLQGSSQGDKTSNQSELPVGASDSPPPAAAAESEFDLNQSHSPIQQHVTDTQPSGSSDIRDVGCVPTSSVVDALTGDNTEQHNSDPTSVSRDTVDLSPGVPTKESTLSPSSPSQAGPTSLPKQPKDTDVTMNDPMQDSQYYSDATDLPMMHDPTIFDSQPPVEFGVDALSQSQVGPDGSVPAPPAFMSDYLDTSQTIAGDVPPTGSDFIPTDGAPHLTNPTQLQMDIDPPILQFPENPEPSEISIPPPIPSPTSNSNLPNADQPPSEPAPSGLAPTQPNGSLEFGPSSSLRLSPSWPTAHTSDGEATVVSSATNPESTSSPGTVSSVRQADGKNPQSTGSEASNPADPTSPSAKVTATPEVKPNLSERSSPAVGTVSNGNGVANTGPLHGPPPDPTTSQPTKQSNDLKTSPKIPKAVNSGVTTPGDPKAAVVLALNEQLIKYVKSMALQPAPEIMEYQQRLSSNLNWLASAADTVSNHVKPGTQFHLPIIQPPTKPLPPSPQLSLVADAVEKLPSLYMRMQEVFKVDYERRVRRDSKLRMRAAAASSAMAGMGMNGSMAGAPGSHVMSPPAAAMPVAGVKRELDGEAEVGERKRVALPGGGLPMEQTMSATGSPTRPSTVRAASLSLSTTQSPVLAGQSPMASASMSMSTPRMPSQGFVQPMMVQQRHSPQNQTHFGSSQSSPVHMTQQQASQQSQQRQPSLPPNSHPNTSSSHTLSHPVQQQPLPQPTSHGMQQQSQPLVSPTHGPNPTQQQIQQMYLQNQQQSQPGSAMMGGSAGLVGVGGPTQTRSQTPGSVGGRVPSPQRPPSVSQAQSQIPGRAGTETPFQQQPPPFHGMGAGMGRLGPQQHGQVPIGQTQTMMGGMNVNGIVRPDDQRTQQLQMQFRQHMAQTQGPLQQQQHGQLGQQIGIQNSGQGATMLQQQQPGMGVGASNGPMSQAAIQQAISALQNPSHPFTLHLYRNVPNFGSLPLATQVQHFNALRMIHTQQQQQNGMNNPGPSGLGGSQQQQQAGGSASGLPPNVAGLRNVRQGTGSPRMGGAAPPANGVGTPLVGQRSLSGTHGMVNASQGVTSMAAMQRQLMQQQQAQAPGTMNRMMAGQSPSPSGFGGGQPQMSPVARQGGQGGGSQWGGSGYVSSPLNPGWSPGGNLSGASPVTGGAFHVAGASPAGHQTETTSVGLVENAGSEGIDPSALFNEWTTNHVL
ncbi:hypothetical protein FRB99_008331 [Tulasnella sp. 403]|nr:hypothetical protein FRB99_008331 [Tulasnella sp. 403]